MKVNMIFIPTGGKKISDVVPELLNRTGINIDSGTMTDPAPVFPQATIFEAVRRGFVNAASRAVFALGDEALNRILDNQKSTFTKKIADFLKENNITANVSVDSIVKQGESVALSGSADSIDYEGIIVKYSAVAIDSLRKNDPEHFIVQLFGIIGDESDEILHMIMRTISDEKKEEIIKLIALSFNRKICEKVSDALQKQKIDMALSEFEIV